MEQNNFLFGQGIDREAWYISEFRYVGNMVHIVAQKGARVEQFKFDPQTLEDAGVLAINNLNNLLTLKP